jgi:LuxR family transcriptional regulator, maltose regulon positive regulatory protein
MMTMREILLDSANLLPRPKPPPPVAVDDMTQRIPDVSRARRHIIKRPRLTRLLDETSARIILLAAPAGYGKTTLAREWLEGAGRPYAWYSATPASADVAVLALGVARALESVVPGISDRLAALLRVPQNEPSVDGLADIILEQLAGTPDALLAIDDCHLASSAASERFVRTIAYETSIGVVLTARARPSWVNAKSILYGEVAELGPQALSLSGDEAAAVLAHHGHEPSLGLLALADGWPAVIGLASLGDRIVLPEGQLASPLYEYIAQELFEGTSDEAHLWLKRLSIVRRPTIDLLEQLAGARASAVVAEATHRGLCSIAPDGRIELHPLLRRFLQRHAGDDKYLSTIAASAVEYFIHRSEWDDAHEIAIEHHLYDAMLEVITEAFTSLLVEGRTSTLRGWLQLARNTRDDPVLDLIEGELAFIEADPSRSRTLASRAQRRLQEGHALKSRAHLRVAYANFLLEDLGEAAVNFLAAEETAETKPELRAAKWGRFLTSVHSDLPGAHSMLQELMDLASSDEPEDLVLISQARLELALQGGGLDAAFEAAEPACHLVDRVEDPQRRTAFYLAMSWAAHLTARYELSLEIAERLLEESRLHQLSFAVPHGLVARAAALSGLRRFVPARRDLREALRIAGDAHTRANAACCEARIDLVTGRRDRALERLQPGPERVVAAPMRAEYTATRALVLACLGREDALAEADAAARISPAIEAEVLAAATRAVVAAGNTGDTTAIRELVECVERTGDTDGAILAWRASPRLLLLIEEVGGEDLAKRLTPTEGDRRIARQKGLGSGASLAMEPLSPREEEVLGLVARGMRNKEIAATLFISEVTVKVHVRHILRKLGVRTRVEAAMQARARDASP